MQRLSGEILVSPVFGNHASCWRRWWESQNQAKAPQEPAPSPTEQKARLRRSYVALKNHALRGCQQGEGAWSWNVEIRYRRVREAADQGPHSFLWKWAWMLVLGASAACLQEQWVGTSCEMPSELG